MPGVWRSARCWAGGRLGMWLAEVAKWLTHWGAVKQTTKILGSNRSGRSKITHFYGHLISKYDRKLGFNPMWIYVRMMNAHLVSVSQSLVDQMGSNWRNLAKSNPQQTNSCSESRRAIPSGSLLHGYGNSPFWSLVNHWTIGRFQLAASWSFGHGSGQDGQDPHGFATLRVFFFGRSKDPMMGVTPETDFGGQNHGISMSLSISILTFGKVPTLEVFCGSAQLRSTKNAKKLCGFLSLTPIQRRIQKFLVYT